MHANPTQRLRLCVIGLGRMGRPIAGHLADAGHSVRGYDRSEAAREHASERGLAVEASAAAAAEGAHVVLTVLPGPAEVEEAMSGDCGLLRNMRPGSCWLDLTSNDPRVAERIASVAAAGGVHAVGAPMGGGVEAAQDAALQFYVGGSKAGRELVAPILDLLARPGGIRFSGKAVGAGFSAKLLINLLWFGQVAAVTEALLLGRRLGLPPNTLRDLLHGSAGDSAFAQRHLDQLLAGDYAETFGLRECVNELDLLTELASDAGSPFVLSSAVAHLHQQALDRFGAVDGEMLVAKMLEQCDGAPLHATVPRANSAATAPTHSSRSD